jgi:hypothetical protein
MAEGDGWDGLALTDSQNLAGDVFAGLALAALVAQFVALVGRGLVPAEHFFSYFTIQSNLLVAIAAVGLALAPDRDGALWRVLRLDGLIGISVTGVVYTTVLRVPDHLHGWAAATDAVFHYAVPLATVLGWLAFGPRPRCDVRTVAWSLVWPVAWIIYTLLHGSVTHWYPYPFIDVTVHGYGLVLLNAFAVAAVLALMAAVFWLGDAYLPGGRGRPGGGQRVLPGLPPPQPGQPSAVLVLADPVVDQAEQPADHADDDRAPERRPEPGDMERQL